MNIIQDFIPAGWANRPNTNPKSSLYKKVIKPEWVVIHNPAAPSWDAKRLHDYGKSQNKVGSLKSWHFSVDKDTIYQMTPIGEATWQAGDNLGQGNTNSISMEICDRGMYRKPPIKELFWQDMENGARLCAHLIKTVPSLRPFPECITQHNKWSGKNCPSWIRSEAGGWNKFLALVKKHIDGESQPWPTYPIPKILRTIGVETNGQRTTEVAYLINNATYVKAAYLESVADIEVTGHGDHIRIVTGGVTK